MQSNETQIDRNHCATDELKMEKRSSVAKAPAFSIRHRVDLELDLELALAIGDHILSSQCSNPAIVALGHRLQNLDGFFLD